MRIFRYDDFETLSGAAAEQIVMAVIEKPGLKICLATGSSPKRCYEKIAEKAASSQTSFRKVQVVKLDEWGGLTQFDEGSCEHYIQKYFIGPLQIDTTKYLSFAGDAKDREQECTRVRTKLSEEGPIDVCVLGLGLNGHLGFNEPAEYLHPFSHIAALSAQSQQHSMVASSARTLEFGYTLGMAEILASRKIIFIVNGESKKQQLTRFLEGKVSTQFPGSFLWLHPDVDLYTDLPV